MRSVPAAVVLSGPNAGRSVRSLRACGLDAVVRPDLSGLRGPLLVLPAGAWLGAARCPVLPDVPGLVAVGRTPGGEWDAVLAASGGDLDRLKRRWPAARLRCPPVAAVFVAEAERLGTLLARGASFDAAVAQLVASRASRSVRLPSLDGRRDAGLRVLQVVTSLQTGGAERVVLELAAELNRQGTATAVAATGRPMRAELPRPPAFFDLSGVARDAETLGGAVAACAVRWGADVVHAHLVRGDLCRVVRGHGLPVAVTAHNLPVSWPDGLAAPGAADLLIGCSLAVSEALWQVAPPYIPVRTVWNGIVPSAWRPDESVRRRGAAWREAHGLSPDDHVVLVLANQRPQKRLDLLPGILAWLVEREPRVCLLLAGEPAPGEAAAGEALREVFAARGLTDRVRVAGTVTDVPAVLAAADVLLAPSAWEGLSVAQLEALAAGLPVVATGDGGTAELAAHHAALTWLPVSAGPEAIAAAVLAALQGKREPVPFPMAFTRHRMGERVRRLLARLAQPAPAATPCVWLVTNNFSTGGAQTSARRLLTAFHAAGVRVRAAVVQEEPGRPTPGRRALVQSGIPVHAAPPPEHADPVAACESILSAMEAAPPTAVLFWNLLPVQKVLLADALAGVAVHDVSPGAMNWESLTKWLSRPRAEAPVLRPADHGCLLTSCVVKHRGEADEAAALLGCDVHVIPNGLTIPPEPLRRPRPRGRLVFGTAARLSPDKRLDELLEAFRLALPRLPDCELRIAGGPERDHPGHARTLRRQARGLPVRWLGRLADTAVLHRRTDIFVMVSDPPGCPNASLEGLAAGLPVIATDVGGAREQVIDGETGLLVPSRDPAALAEAMVRLAADAGLRDRLAAAGRAHAVARFSVERMAADYARLLGIPWEEAGVRRAGFEPATQGL